MYRVVIIGAGISGLSVAFRLQQARPDIDLTVLEMRDRPGGTTWTERHDGFQVEIGPNGFQDNRPSTLALCHDAGLGSELCPASAGAARNRYLFLGTGLRPLPHSLVAFLRSDFLSWRGKMTILAERLRRRGDSTCDESIDAFVRRRAGSEAAELLADALVTGIHAGDPALLSVRAAFPRLVEMEQRYGSVMRGLATARRQTPAAGEAKRHRTQMWSLRPGLRCLVEKLCNQLNRPPQLGISVCRLERVVTPQPGQSPWVVHGEGRDRWLADAVVLTCPTYNQAELLADLDQALAERIATIPYNSVAVVALGYPRSAFPGSLDGFGFIAPQRLRRDLLGVQWCSSIFADRAPPGMVLLRAMCGGWNRPDMVSWNDDRLIQAVVAELRLAMRVDSQPVFHRIIRWERAIPQYHLGHLDRVRDIQQRLEQYPGLFIGGNAYKGISLNDCTEQGELLARRITALLPSTA